VLKCGGAGNDVTQKEGNELHWGFEEGRKGKQVCRKQSKRVSKTEVLKRLISWFLILKSKRVDGGFGTFSFTSNSGSQKGQINDERRN